MKINVDNAWYYTAHINNLATIAGIEMHKAEKAYKSLRRLEAKANRICTRECNEANFDGSNQLEAIKKRVLELLPGLKGFFINTDPRGYSLKITEDETKALRAKGINIYTDWGGYGILAPEF